MPGSRVADDQAADTRITEAELRAFCPTVQLRQASSTKRVFERGGDGDASRLIHQATLSEVTRSCAYEGGMLRMTVAAAGRVTPGPRGSAGTVRLPVRVFAVEGAQTLYSQTFDYPVEVTATTGATQFLFTDPNAVFPAPSSRNVVVFVEFAG